jgi:glyoxylase-like metal-dependent hydrolase (beta-lactamase superfamily II)
MDERQGISRATFLQQAVGVLVGGTVAVSGCLGGQSAAVKAHASKGLKGSKIKQWDVITIGNLSRNRYWGESDDMGVRSTLCTTTLITGDGFRILVDPSLADAAQMKHELDRRTGAKPRDVTAVFVTHEHPDHYEGIAHFPDARWLAAPAVAEILNKSGKLPRVVEGCTDQLFDAVEVIPTPGHTHAHHSLVFDCAGLRIIVAGDSAITQDFFRDRRGYRNAVDFELSTRTIDKLAAMADIIIPGHDNYFLADYVG